MRRIKENLNNNVPNHETILPAGTLILKCILLPSMRVAAYRLSGLSG